MSVPPLRHTILHWLIWIPRPQHWLVSIHKSSMYCIYKSGFVPIVWAISCCVGLYKSISHNSMSAVFTNHNPALLYKPVKSIVLINKPYYCLAWFYNLQHCSFSSSLIAVCIVGAKNPSAAEITSFVKVFRKCFGFLFFFAPFKQSSFCMFVLRLCRPTVVLATVCCRGVKTKP